MTESKNETEPIEIAKRVLAALKQDHKLRDEFIELVKPGEYVKRDELTELLDEIRNLRLESAQRYQAMDDRFEALQRQMDERFTAMQKQMDERFDESNRRFEAMQKQMDERFTAMQKQMDERFDESNRRFEVLQKQMDERFTAMQKQMDERFAAVDKRFESMLNAMKDGFAKMDKRMGSLERRMEEISHALGHDFEEFNREWLRAFLNKNGIPDVEIRKRHFVDRNHEVFPDTTDVEIDLFNEEPLLVGEVTAIVRSLEKVEIFLRKVKFIEGLYGRPAEQKLFITYYIEPQILSDVIKKLSEAGVRIISVSSIWS